MDSDIRMSRRQMAGPVGLRYSCGWLPRHTLVDASGSPIHASHRQDNSPSESFTSVCMSCVMTNHRGPSVEAKSAPGQAKADQPAAVAPLGVPALTRLMEMYPMETQGKSHSRRCSVPHRWCRIPQKLTLWLMCAYARTQRCGRAEALRFHGTRRCKSAQW